MALGDGIARNKGHKSFAYQKGYKSAVDDMTNNIIRNSRTEIIDGKITLVITEERVRIISAQMKNSLNNLFQPKNSLKERKGIDKLT